MLKRVAFVFAAVVGALGFALVPATVSAAQQNSKVFVCKYVGKPGVDERLQTGQNPISVSVNAINQNQWNGTVPGYFSDAQDRSYVLEYDNGQDEPDVSECPAPSIPELSFSVACEVVGGTLRNVVTVNNSGTAKGTITVNGLDIELDPGESDTVEVPAGESIVIEIGEQEVYNETPVCVEGGRGGEETPVTPVTTTPQVDAPVAGVNAGSGAVVGAGLALAGSLGSLGYGVARLRKTRV